ncbi:Plb1p [Sugiyamaella lignohabitans]|uniref:Lysophospholipase n=1 Tax=Sugiyamaella lignohabitans TaxID=796027 RepID=A0A167CL27_9ASCO|nr:Plb1p [Sugiyamaella lignohabitans]ANB11836.1 Plb1p [Sugiyamaella lignohabitans]
MHFSHILPLLLAVPALAGSPTGGYTPGQVDCPDGSLVRPADSLNPKEADFVQKRHEVARPALIDWLNRANLSDFSADQFLSNSTIPIAIAFSGGGYRAMLAGAGEFSALDNRTANSTNQHHMGGLVQAATYFAGLSGGNWLLGSIVMNNFTSIPELQGSSDVWDLSHSILNPGGINVFSTASYWDDIADDVKSKKKAGFNTSITDIWGRALSHQFFNLSNGGPALTFDDVVNYDVFQNHEMPFPIVVSDGRAPGTTVISTNSTVFELTPYELGSWDPTIYAFTQIKYLGTQVQNGKPVNGTCIAGFDNAGFTIGTSSTLFNQFILQINSTGVSGVVYDLATDILDDIGKKSDDIAIYDPNPFFKVDTVTNGITTNSVLNLVDGGEDNENIPLVPLIQPERKLDVVFAFDNSADTTYNWPNGSSLVASFQRQFGNESNNTIFPYVPDTNTFINNGYTKRPTFFGCNATNLTSLFNDSQSTQDHFVPPLIIYIANFAHSYFSNTSTFKMSYETDEVAGMIENGYNVVTQQNGTIDSDWPACVGCAIIKRELDRRGQSPTDQCQQCFDKYCWDSAVDNQAVNISGENFAPTLSVANHTSSASVATAGSVFTTSLYVICAVGALFLFA